MMMRAARAIPALVGLIGLSVAQAQTAIPEVPVLSPPFQERIDPNILSAGGLVVGLVGGDMKGPVDQSMITLSGIDRNDAYICVTLQHVAGAYSGGFIMKNPRRGPTVGFRIPARLIAGLKAQTATLAILAKAGQDVHCTDKNAAILPAAWGRTVPGAAVYALVNDHQADITMARVDASPLKRCTPIGQFADSRLALRSYQIACQVDISGECASKALLVIKFLDGASVTDIRPAIRRAC